MEILKRIFRSFRSPLSKALESPTFCVYPWLEQVVQPTGKISYCCVAKNGGSIAKEEAGQFYRVSEDSLRSAWNSLFMRRLREGMLKGEKISTCQTCYFQEGIGKKSYRQMHNEEWLSKARNELENRIKVSVQNDFHLNVRPVFLDLRLGNLCNLKCRSCNPYNSLPIHKETVKLLANNPTYKEFWFKFNRTPPPEEMKPWYEEEKFWDELKENLPVLRKVYLTGGEPTLIKKNYEFMRQCVDSGHAKNIFLMFNTNGTNVSDEFLELLPHFQFVLMNVSLDGWAEENEYIRFPSRWRDIDKNMRRLAELPEHVQLGVTPVIQIYNILTITQLLDYVEQISQQYKRIINVDFLYATSPSYIDVRILPSSVREAANKKLEVFAKRSRLIDKEPFLANSILSCSNLLSGERFKNADQLLHDFMHFTELLDEERKQDFTQVFPELASLLKEWSLKHVH